MRPGCSQPCFEEGFESEGRPVCDEQTGNRKKKLALVGYIKSPMIQDYENIHTIPSLCLCQPGKTRHVILSDLKAADYRLTGVTDSNVKHSVRR